jgi:hypothetical protein
MSENPDLHANPSGSKPPVGVDLLGQNDANFQQSNPTDHSYRELIAIFNIRKSIRKRGGQPR